MKHREINVGVLGASAKPERYSNQAVKLLLDEGYNVIPINPAGIVIEGLASVRSLAEINIPLHVLTVYINSVRSSQMANEIINTHPETIIFNPGTENSELELLCEKNGISVKKACTLVLLKTGQFDSLLI